MNQAREDTLSTSAPSIVLAACIMIGMACDGTSPNPVTPGPATTFRFASSIQNATAGTAFSAVLVDVIDADGNVVTDATTPITISSSGGTSQIAGTLSRNAVAGRATFDDLSLCQGWTSYNLIVSGSGLTSATSNQFTVLPGTMTKLVFSAQPTGAKGGAVLPSFSVAANDACGNSPIPPGGPMSIVIGLGANPGGATLSGTLTRTGFAAVVQFNDLVIDKPGSGYTLVATISGTSTLTPATSATFVISP